MAIKWDCWCFFLIQTHTPKIDIYKWVCPSLFPLLPSFMNHRKNISLEVSLNDLVLKKKKEKKSNLLSKDKDLPSLKDFQFWSWNPSLTKEFISKCLIRKNQKKQITVPPVKTNLTFILLYYIHFISLSSSITYV